MNKNIQIFNSIVFLRVDFNVPIIDGVILDDKRINDVLPTILSLLKNHNKIILASHFGRPKAFDQSLSLKPIHDYLCKKLNSYKLFFAEKIDNSYCQLVSELNFGEILMLENLRFYSEEESCDENFMKFLAKPADYYCNEAFSCSHRAHASIMMGKFFDPNHKFLGYLFQKEINAIDNFLKNKTGKSIAIIGGSKISSKIHLLSSLQTKVDSIFVVGAMANTLLKYKGIEVGQSLVEDNCDKMIEDLLHNSEENNCDIILPDDFVVTDNIENPIYIKKTNLVNKNDIIVDIGENSINALSELLKKCDSVLWNGPAGVFEVKPFEEGTLKITQLIADFTQHRGIKSIIGGGDTVAAINDDNLLNKFTHVSTAGGAFLEYIEQGGNLVGIDIIKSHDI